MDNLQSQDPKVRLETLEKLITKLKQRSYLRELQNDVRTKLMHSIYNIMKDANPKIAVVGLEVVKIFVTDYADIFQPWLNMYVDVLITKFGDSKANIRQKATEVMIPVVRSQELVPGFDRIAVHLNHKNFRVREQLLCFVQLAQDEFGNEIKNIPNLLSRIAALLNDPQNSVRQLAVETLTKLHGVFGTTLLSNLRSIEGIRGNHIQMITHSIMAIDPKNNGTTVNNNISNSSRLSIGSNNGDNNYLDGLDLACNNNGGVSKLAATSTKNNDMMSSRKSILGGGAVKTANNERRSVSAMHARPSLGGINNDATLNIQIGSNNNRLSLHGNNDQKLGNASPASFYSFSSMNDDNNTINTNGTSSNGSHFDVSIFVSLFKDGVAPIPIKIHNERELNKFFATIQTNLSKADDWQARINAMIMIQNLAYGNFCEYEQLYTSSMKSIQDQLTAQIGDLRSAIVKEACRTVAVLSYRLPNLFFSQLHEFFFPVMMKQVVVKIQVVASAVDRCARIIAVACPESKIMSQWIDQLMSNKSSVAKRYCIEYLCIACALWRYDIIEKNMSGIKNAIKACISDADSNTRKSTRYLYCVLYERIQFQGIMETFFNKELDSTVQKSIQSEQNNCTSELQDLIFLVNNPIAIDDVYIMTTTSTPATTTAVTTSMNSLGGFSSKSNNSIMTTTTNATAVAVEAIPKLKSQSSFESLESNEEEKINSNTMNNNNSAGIKFNRRSSLSGPAVRVVAKSIEDDKLDNSNNVTMKPPSKLLGGSRRVSIAGTSSFDLNSNNTAVVATASNNPFKSGGPVMNSNEFIALTSKNVIVASNSASTATKSTNNLAGEDLSVTNSSVNDVTMNSTLNSFDNMLPPSATTLSNKLLDNNMILPSGSRRTSILSQGPQRVIKPVASSENISNMDNKIINNENIDGVASNKASSSRVALRDVEDTTTNTQNIVARTAPRNTTTKLSLFNTNGGNGSSNNTTSQYPATEKKEMMASSRIPLSSAASSNNNENITGTLTTSTAFPSNINGNNNHAATYYSLETLRTMVEDSHQWSNRLKAFEYMNYRLMKAIHHASTTSSASSQHDLLSATTTTSISTTTSPINTLTIEAYVEISCNQMTDSHQKVATEAIQVLSHCINHFALQCKSKLGMLLLSLFNRLSDRRQIIRDLVNDLLKASKEKFDGNMLITALSPKLNDIPERMKSALLQYLNMIIPQCTSYFSISQNMWAFLGRISNILSSSGSKPSLSSNVLSQGQRLLELVYKLNPQIFCGQVVQLPYQQQLLIKNKLQAIIPDIEAQLALASKQENNNNNRENHHHKIEPRKQQNSNLLEPQLHFNQFEEFAKGSSNNIENDIALTNGGDVNYNSNTNNTMVLVDNLIDMDDDTIYDFTATTTAVNNVSTSNNQGSNNNFVFQSSEVLSMMMANNTTSTANSTNNGVNLLPSPDKLYGSNYNNNANYYVANDNNNATVNNLLDFLSFEETKTNSSHRSPVPSLPSPPALIASYNPVIDDKIEFSLSNLTEILQSNRDINNKSLSPPKPPQQYSNNTMNLSPIMIHHHVNNSNNNNNSNMSVSKMSTPPSTMMSMFTYNNNNTMNTNSSNNNNVMMMQDRISIPSPPPSSIKQTPIWNKKHSDNQTNLDIDVMQSNMKSTNDYNNVAPRSIQKLQSNNNINSTKKTSPLIQNVKVLSPTIPQQFTPTGIAIPKELAIASSKSAGNSKDVAWILHALRLDSNNTTERAEAAKELKILAKVADKTYWQNHCQQIVTVLLEVFNPAYLKSQQQQLQYSGNENMCANNSNTPLSSSKDTSVCSEFMQTCSKLIFSIVKYRADSVKSFLELLVTRFCHAAPYVPNNMVLIFEQILSMIAHQDPLRLVRIITPFTNYTTNTISLYDNNKNNNNTNNMNDVDNSNSHVRLLALHVLNYGISLLKTQQAMDELSTIIQAILPSMSSSLVDIRKAVVFVLVELHITVGDIIFQYLQDLTPPQKKLLTIYIEKKNTQREVGTN